MLKKKIWLRRWRNFMFESGLWNPWLIELFKHEALIDRQRQLSPGESANENIEFWEDLQCIDKGGG